MTSLGGEHVLSPDSYLPEKSANSDSNMSGRNVFTIRRANHPPCPDRFSRSDYDKQKAMIAAHRQTLHENFIARHESALFIPEQDQAISVKVLLGCAANRDIRLGRKMGYEESVIDFMKQMWSALLHEAVNLLQLNDGASHIREALENISSLGVWFTGPDISLPLRRYTVQVPNEQGGEDSMVVVGLLSFSYSSYIMQLRSISQQTTLSTLASLQEQLGTKCLFIPPLLIASKD